jgi:hypothetical protein
MRLQPGPWGGVYRCIHPGAPKGLVLGYYTVQSMQEPTCPDKYCKGQVTCSESPSFEEQPHV